MLLVLFLVLHVGVATMLATALYVSDSKYLRATMGFMLVLNINQVIDIVVKIS